MGETGVWVEKSKTLLKKKNLRYGENGVRHMGETGV